MQTTVYLIPGDSKARNDRGWPLFEEAACRLFKASPPDRPFKLPHGSFVPLWQKVVDASAMGIRAEEPKRGPPMR